MPRPRSAPAVEVLGGCFLRLTLRFGFMETPNVSRAMAHARRAGLRFDVMTSTFFLGRRRAVATGRRAELVLDRFYVALSRFAADPTDFYHLPRDRVVDRRPLGERVGDLTRLAAHENGRMTSA
jgi:KUP system potassium uptake protein